MSWSAPLHKSSNPSPLGRIRFRARISFSISPTLKKFFEIWKFEKNKNSKIVWWNQKIIFAFYLVLVLNGKRGLNSTVCDGTTTEIRRLSSLFNVPCSEVFTFHVKFKHFIHSSFIQFNFLEHHFYCFLLYRAVPRHQIILLGYTFNKNQFITINMLLHGSS